MGRGNNLLAMPVLHKAYIRTELQQGKDSLDVGELLQSHGSHLHEEVRCQVRVPPA